MKKTIIFLALLALAPMIAIADFGSSGGGSNLTGIPNLGIGQSGDTYTHRIPVWSGADTTTSGTSFSPKAFQVLKLSSDDYKIYGSSATVTFRCIISSGSVDLYDHTAGTPIAGSELINSNTYSTVPSTANISMVEIPIEAFPSTDSIISIRLKSTAGIVARLGNAMLMLKYKKN